MTKVLILAGGNSSEREVSLRSGETVKLALGKAGYKVTFIDPVKPLKDYSSELKQADVVFPALHGRGGEDGELQEFLEKTGVTFVGSDSKASRRCFNKLTYLGLMKGNDILFPQTESVDREQFRKSAISKAPFVLKPIDEGSSIDTIIAKDLSKLDQSSIDLVFSRHPNMMLEPLISGQEITVGVLGNNALPVIEIIPPESEDFDYENKYNGKSQELCPPKNISLEIQVSAQELAQRIHALCGCRDMSRTDMVVDFYRSIYVLETNTIPGLTDQSLLPKAALVAGLNMPDFCSQLVKMALKRSS